MALPALTEVEVRSPGSDNNGGFFVTGGSGTDYSQQDAAQYVIDGVTNTGIVQATTTDILIAGYTVNANDVNNGLQITGGTATAGFYQIFSVNVGTNTYTLDKSAGTAAQTVVGNIGGGLATIGKASSVPLVAANKVWVKYHASNVYTSTSATASVANGRFVITVGTQANPVTLRGYDVTHGDLTGNRPTLKWGVNAGSTYLVNCTGTSIVSNLIFDGNRTNFTLTRGLSTSANNVLTGCKFTSFNNGGINYTGGSHIVEGCEFADCVTTNVVTITTTGQECVFIGNYTHDNTVDAWNLNTTSRFVMIGNIFDTTTGKHVVLLNTGTDGPYVSNNIFYNCTSDAVSIGTETMAIFTNNIFESSGTTSGYAIATTAAGKYEYLLMRNNAFYNNGSGPYDATKVLSMNVSGEVLNTTGTFFVDAPNQNFLLNNTANQGALARAVGYPITFPGTSFTSYRDIGATQHQDTGGGGTVNIFNIME